MSFKNQLRSVTRLLNKEGIHPKVKEAQEKRLEELKKEMEDLDRREREKKFAKKYHKVKFFERVKVERRIGKIKKEGEMTGDMRAELKVLQEDLEYVKHYPNDQKYVALFVGEGDDVEKKRREMRALIKTRLAERALVEDADEGEAMFAAAKRVEGEESGTEEEGSGEESGGSDSEGEGEDDFFLGGSDGEGGHGSGSDGGRGGGGGGDFVLDGDDIVELP
eukprot:CAMPEP_0182903244 /NCGR_PEP_ID=MMETSP0034_2-20130328/31116_1 /TAXON_ID=156128 /ORGANISM="Nephroselmis pyriformis, Strain CCMP717" /LENGTH=220 /DNA_ID=CAMNT_0025038073 /DNA_START=24 /DNA_END=683 /DNA_ORIENTATION=+